MHPVRALFGREAWANRELLRRCAELEPVLLARETPGTYGTIPRTLTHVVGTGQFLLALLTGGQSVDAIQAGEQRDLEALEPVAEDNAARWRSLLDGSPDPDAPAGGEDQDRHGGPPGWVFMVQCIHHGDTHRAHVSSALGAAGVEPPRLSGWAFGSLDPAADGPAGEWADALLPRFFDHAGWATDKVLEHCLELGEAALRATAPGTYGTAHETLTHLVDAHCDYVGKLMGAEDVFLEGAAEPDVLRAALERGRERWRAYLEAGPDHERVVAANGAARPAWVATLQAVHHVNDHLAHAGTILGANGLPVPDVDAWAYYAALSEPAG
jgi:uncharacterized damage-inducible protein DinB